MWDLPYIAVQGSMFLKNIFIPDCRESKGNKRSILQCLKRLCIILPLPLSHFLLFFLPCKHFHLKCKEINESILVLPFPLLLPSCFTPIPYLSQIPPQLHLFDTRKCLNKSDSSLPPDSISLSFSAAPSFPISLL